MAGNSMVSRKLLEREKKRQRKTNLEGFLFISPWIIGFLLLMLGPMVFSLVISFTEWNMLGTPVYVGIENYIRMFTADPFYYKSLEVTFKYVFVVVPLQVVIGILLAVLINQAARGIKVFRAIFYMPSLIQGVSLSLIWLWLYNNDFGPFNNILSQLGLPRIEWLTDPQMALNSLIIMAVWGVGAPTVLYLAALQNISADYYEAASIDGAGAVKQFMNITLPMLTPTILFNIITIIFVTFQQVVQAFVMTGGGPAYETYFYSLHVYRTAFVHFEMGYASAMAWVMFVLILVIVALILKTSKYWVHYEADRSDKD